jgi:hypothetical protein
MALLFYGKGSDTNLGNLAFSCGLLIIDTPSPAEHTTTVVLMLYPVSYPVLYPIACAAETKPCGTLGGGEESNEGPNPAPLSQFSA